MPPLSLGKHPNLIYVNNTVSDTSVPGQVSSRLFRYDSVTEKSELIAKLPEIYLNDVQVSPDGQWILFDAKNSARASVQIIRIDGKFLQTLYCYTGGDSAYAIQQITRSPDQKSISFIEPPTSGPVTPIYVLHTTTGKVETLATLDSGSQYLVFQPVSWYDNTHLYIERLSKTPYYQ